MGKKKLASEVLNDQLSGNTPTLVDHSVDELAKGLASGTLSRRRALKMLGATLFGGVLASIPGVALAAKPQTSPGPRCSPECPEGYTCTPPPQGGSGVRGKPLQRCCPADPQGDCCFSEDFCSNGECCSAGQCTSNGECCVGEIMPNGECCEGGVMFNGECCPSPMNYCRNVYCDESGCVECEVCCPAGVQCVPPETQTGCPITCAS